MSLSISRLYHVSILLASMEEYNPAATTITIKGVSATRSFWRNFRLANRPMWNALPGAYGGHDLRLTSLVQDIRDRKSTRLNSSHVSISYAVFCSHKNINMQLPMNK